MWVSWTEFEVSIGEIQRARELFSRANTSLEGSPSEERLFLLEQWRDFERQHGDDNSLAVVEKLMPKRVKRRKQITTEDGMDAGWEEYFDYIFPQDASLQRNFRLLEAARQWRQKQTAEDEGENGEGRGGGSGAEESGESDEVKAVFLYI